MTATEAIVIIGGAALGYWLVAVFLPNMRTPAQKRPAQKREPAVHDSDATPAALYSTPWHEVLGVSRDASQEEIQAAYVEKVRQYESVRLSEPDAGTRELAVKQLAEIHAAYDQAVWLRD